MCTGSNLNVPRKFAGLVIVMELESVLQSEPCAPFCRHFSVSGFSSSLSMCNGTEEI